MIQRLPRLLAALLLLAPLAATAAGVAGTVVMLTGRATALGVDGTVRTLAKNDTVFSGDLVNSGAGSYVNLKFADGAFFLLRPETRFQIEQYDYVAAATPVAPVKPPPAAATPPPAPLVTTPQQQAGSGTSRAFFRLVKGGFRSVSGLIGKLNHDDYRVSTPVATIGIRGTRYSARLCEGACEDREQIVTKLRGVGKSVTPDEIVLVTTVDDGSIELQSGQGSTVQNACRASSDEQAGKASPCTAVFTSSDGSTTVVPTRPSIEDSERSLNPAFCS